MDNGFKEANPILVEATRGSIVETFHRGSVAIVNADGKTFLSIGDVDTPMYFRSTAKPLQALPLLESGAADKFNLSKEEITLACSSHSGEKKHTDAVKKWLERIGLSLDDLECGVAIPYGAEAAFKLKAEGGKPEQVHNCCSGKHAGFMTLAVHMGFPVKGYSKQDHPVQKMIKTSFEKLIGREIIDSQIGTDGCGVPVYCFSLKEVAFAFANLSENSKDMKRIIDAILQCPEYLGGKNRYDTEVTKISGNVITKSGVQGAQIAIVTEKGYSVTLKIDDDNETAKRVAMSAILNELGALNDEHIKKLERWLKPDMKDANGKIVGHIRPSAFLKKKVSDCRV